MTRSGAGSDGRAVVLFDLDGVLARRDTFTVFVQRRLRSGPWRLPLVAPLLPALALAGERPVLRGLLVRRVVRAALAGVDLAEAERELTALGEEFARTPSWLLADGIVRARGHLHQGSRVVVVTASERHLARALLDGVGLEDAELFASELARRPGGLALRPHNYGRNKARSLEAAGLLPPWSVMYTDSVADLPALREADAQVLVNPSRAMQALLTPVFPTTMRVERWR